MHILIGLLIAAAIIVAWALSRQERRRLAIIRRQTQMLYPHLTREQVEAQVDLHRKPSLRQLNRRNRQHYRQQAQAAPEPSPEPSWSWDRSSIMWTTYVTVMLLVLAAGLYRLHG